MAVATYSNLLFVNGYESGVPSKKTTHIQRALQQSHIARVNHEARRKREKAAKIDRSDKPGTSTNIRTRQRHATTKDDENDSGYSTASAADSTPSTKRDSPDPSSSPRANPSHYTGLDAIPNATALLRFYASSKTATPVVKDALYTCLAYEVCRWALLSYASAIISHIQPGTMTRYQAYQMQSRSTSALHRYLQTDGFDPALALRAVVFLTVVAIREGDVEAARAHLLAVRLFARDQIGNPDMMAWLNTAQFLNAQYAVAKFEPILIPPVRVADHMIPMEATVDKEQMRLGKRIEMSLDKERKALFRLLADSTRLLTSGSFRPGSTPHLASASSKLFQLMFELSRADIKQKLSSPDPDSCRLDLLLLMAALLAEYSLTTVSQVESVLVGNCQTKYLLWQHPAIPTPTSLPSTDSSSSTTSESMSAHTNSLAVRALTLWNSIIANTQPASPDFRPSMLILQLTVPLRLLAGDNELYVDITNFMQSFLQKYSVLVTASRAGEDRTGGGKEYKNTVIKMVDDRGRMLGLCSSRLG